MLDKKISISYLQKFLTNNKAKGIISELDLESYIQELNQPNKHLSGGWLTALFKWVNHNVGAW
jgi:hypothetical protein